MVSHVQIYTYMIIASVVYGITELLKAVSSKSMNNGVFQLYFYLFSALIVPIIFIFTDKDFNIKNLTSLTKNDILLTAICGICIVITNYFYLKSTKMNSELKTPINVGILSAVLALYFIVTIVADIFLKMWKRERVHITTKQIIGCVLIIAGIITISTE